MEPKITVLKRLKLAVRGQDEPPAQDEFQEFLDGIDTDVVFSDVVLDRVSQGVRIRFQYQEGSRKGWAGILFTPSEVQLRLDSSDIQSQPNYRMLKRVLEDRFSVNQDLSPVESLEKVDALRELDSVVDVVPSEGGVVIQYSIPSEDGPIFGEMELVARKDGMFRVLRWDVGRPPRSMVLGGEVYSVEQVTSGLTTMQFPKTSESLEEGWKDWALAAALAAAPMGSDANQVAGKRPVARSAPSNEQPRRTGVSPEAGARIWRLADSATDAFKGNLDAGPQVKYLVYFTLMVESGGGRWRENKEGVSSAAGLAQVLSGTAKDLLVRWLPARPKTLKQFRDYTGVLASPERMAADSRVLLRTNDKFAAAMCRLRYAYVGEKIPSDLKSIAAYWKKHYNASKDASELSAEEAVTSFLRLTRSGGLASK